MPKKKKLVPNSGKSIVEIMKDNEVTNSDGCISQAFSKDYDYFEDINCIYSEEYPEGKMLDLIHIKLYCRFKRYQNNGAKCYESQGRLGKICRCDPGTIGDKVKELVKMGLVTTEPNPDPRYDTLLYTALPLTDAHVIPPEGLTAQPVTVSDGVPQQPVPESDKVIVEQSVPDWDDIPCVWDDPAYQPTSTAPIQQDTPELPWGGVAICKTNGDPTDAALKWALTEIMGDEEEAYRLISRVVSDYTGKEHCFTPRTEDEFDPIPF
ncbi:MarR family transcriptional regulator [Enterobacter oligotrophicus]|uniref:MarR family transcriptional regulator n=1 Tax=Enterobacter oligotrophicus TaxID=2478464 RepID=UPI0028AA31B6|nr:MarR family transcriptional regulator [Enterobacter oligotrophicus]